MGAQAILAQANLARNSKRCWPPLLLAPNLRPSLSASKAVLPVMLGLGDCFLGIVLGLGIGAYSAQHGLRDCLDGTFHLTKKSAISAKEKAGPHLAKAHEAAMPYVKQVSAQVNQKISSLSEKK